MAFTFTRPRGRRLIALTTLLLSVFMLGIACLPQQARAATGADTAGNSFASEERPDSKTENDLYWAGQSLDLYDGEIGNDVIAAGESLDVQDCTVGGSIRMAGRILDITRTKVAHTVTVAGEHIAIKSGTEAGGIYAAGKTINFQGSASSATLAGQTVTLNGTVNGDVTVYASKLVIKKGTKITGTLRANVGEQPSKAAGASIGKLDVTMDEADSSQDTGFDPASTVLSVAMSLFSGIILALIVPRCVRNGAQMLHTRPLALLASGLLGLVAMVPVAVMVCLTVAGLPIAGVLLCLLIAVFLIAAPFAGACAAMALMPQWNRFGAAAAGSVVAGVLTNLPFVGGFFNFAAVILVLGYLIRTIWANMRPPRTTPPQASLPE